MIYVSHSVEDTRLLGREQALELTRSYEGSPIVIALEGELGAGKTTFVQAFAAGLGVADRVKSPTFVLMKDYELESTPGYHHLYHLDCYRLNGPSDLYVLGASELLTQFGSIVLVEWAERVAGILPRGHLVVHIDHIAEHIRNIHIYKKE